MRNFMTVLIYDAGCAMTVLLPSKADMCSAQAHVR